VTQQTGSACAEAMEAALELGRDGHFDMSNSKLALNEKRLPHSISDRIERITRDWQQKVSKQLKHGTELSL
jgi:hypothetical protein